MRILRAIALLALALHPLRVTAQSPCTGLALPLADDFDSYTTGALPACWWGTRNYDLGPAPRIDN